MVETHIIEKARQDWDRIKKTDGRSVHAWWNRTYKLLSNSGMPKPLVRTVNELQQKFESES